VTEAEADHEELVRQADWARLAAQDEVDAMRGAKAQVGATEQAVIVARDALVKVEQRIALAEASRSAINRRTTEIVGLAQIANRRLEELARLEQAARAKLSEAATDLAGLRDETARLGEELQALAARVETRKAALMALAQEWRHQRDIAESLEGQIRRNREEIERATTERTEFERELATLAAQDEVAQARQI
jgi:chromosome segregation ATPase